MLARAKLAGVCPVDTRDNLPSLLLTLFLLCTGASHPSWPYAPCRISNGVGAAARALPVACHMPIGGDDSRKRIDKLPARPRGGDAVDVAVPERSRVLNDVRPAEPGASVDLRASAPLFPGVAMIASRSYHFVFMICLKSTRLAVADTAANAEISYSEVFTS